MSKGFDYTGALLIAACVLLAAATTADADSIVYRVDSEATVAEYAVLWLGVLKQRGRFARTRGAIIVDPATRAGKIEFTVDARSVDSGWDMRDAFLRDEAMLDTQRYRWIHFDSTRLAFAEDRLARIDGRLTLRGVTQDIALTVSRFDCGMSGGDSPETCEADASATIRRSDFGMKGFVPVIDDAVTLDFAVVARRAPAGDLGERP